MRKGECPQVSEREGKSGDKPIGIPRLDALREARRDSRFNLNVEVTIDSISTGSVSGRTLDLTDHGSQPQCLLNFRLGKSCN
jgi:hypothetical protein